MSRGQWKICGQRIWKWHKGTVTNDKLCGINVHHQNGKAEKRIRDLQERTRTMLLHAIHQWPGAITLHLWPYDLQIANEIRNIIPKCKMTWYHGQYSPAYMLENELQQKKKINICSQRSRVGIYLGPSLAHATTVHLILSIKMCAVPPQYHVDFENYFESTIWMSYMPKSELQTKARLVKRPDTVKKLKKSQTCIISKKKQSKMQLWNTNKNFRKCTIVLFSFQIMFHEVCKARLKYNGQFTIYVLSNYKLLTNSCKSRNNLNLSLNHTSIYLT